MKNSDVQENYEYATEAEEHRPSDDYKIFYEMVKKWTMKDYGTPGLKAEIIIDMLISEFVADIVSDGLDLSDRPICLAKEFPIMTFRKDQMHYQLDRLPGENNYSSRNAKVDFLLAAEEKQGKKVLYLVELKSAKESFDDKQLMRMLFVAEGRPDAANRLFEFYGNVVKTSRQKKKYRAQSSMIKDGLKKLNSDDISEYKVKCLYLSLGKLVDNRRHKGAELYDDGKKIFEMAPPKFGGQDKNKSGSIQTEIYISNKELNSKKSKRAEIPVINLLNYSPRDESIAVPWEMVKKILEGITKEQK